MLGSPLLLLLMCGCMGRGGPYGKARTECACPAYNQLLLRVLYVPRNAMGISVLLHPSTLNQ